MSDILLHHYPQSPVAEKVRTVLGIKGLGWGSVTIPRLPPKPDLVALTGGYRRTPVMQIGADVYCDSQCIIAEIERRHPQPSLFTDAAPGTVWALSRWTDECLFPLVIAVVLGREAGELAPEFAADRGRLYFGREFDLDVLAAELSNNVAQLRAQLTWMQEMLAGRAYFAGADPGLVDALMYFLVWFISGRFRESEALLAPFEKLRVWQSRVAAIGHGEYYEVTPDEALEVAAAHTSGARESVESDDGLAPGDRISVVQVGDGGDPEVHGELVRIGLQEVALRRVDERAGEVVVHFPRVGYRVMRV